MDPEQLLDLARRMEQQVARTRDMILAAMEELAESAGVPGVTAAVDVVGSAAADLLDALHHLVADLVAAIERIVAALGDPAGLDRISARWSAEVGAAATELIERIEPTLVQQDGTWSGEAAEAYRSVVTIQLRALDDVVTPIVTGVQAALSEAVTGLWAFRIAVGVALLGVILGLSAVFALVPLLGAVATGAVAVSSAMWLLVVDLSDASSGLTATSDLTRSEWPRPAG